MNYCTKFLAYALPVAALAMGGCHKNGIATIAPADHSTQCTPYETGMRCNRTRDVLFRPIPTMVRVRDTATITGERVTLETHCFVLGESLGKTDKGEIAFRPYDAETLENQKDIIRDSHLCDTIE